MYLITLLPNGISIQKVEVDGPDPGQLMFCQAYAAHYNSELPLLSSKKYTCLKDPGIEI